MRKGNILKIKTGVNPNSSSIGTDLAALLMSAAAVTLTVNLLDAALRLWWRRGKSRDATN